MTVAQILFLYC